MREEAIDLSHKEDFIDAVYEADVAAYGDSNDAEIQALKDALSCAIEWLAFDGKITHSEFIEVQP